MVWHLSTLSIHLSSRLAAWSGTGNPYCLHALIPAFSKVILIPLGLSWCRIPLHRMGISEYPSNGILHHTDTYEHILPKYHQLSPSKSANPPIERDHCNLIKEKMINWPYASESLRQHVLVLSHYGDLLLERRWMFGPFFLVSYSRFMTLSKSRRFQWQKGSPFMRSPSRTDWIRRTWSLFLVTRTSENLRQLRWSSPCI